MKGNHTNARSSLPWWTWILPFFVANLGTWLSIWFKTDPGASLWYLPTALGIVMVYWWGPRVLLGVYLNAVVCAPLWDLPWQSSFLYALPETLGVGLSWLFFIKIGRGKYWLPDLKNVIGFLLFGSIIPTFIANVYLVMQLYLLGDIPENTILDNWLVVFSSDLASQFVITVPLLVIFTRAMHEKGWTQTREIISRLTFLPEKRNSRLDIAFVITIFVAALILIVLFSIHDLWILYGFLMILIAIRYGVNMAVIGTSWIGMLAFLLPVILTGKLGLPTASYGDFVSTNLDILFLCGVTLLTGRAISDLFIEINERKHVEEELRVSEELHRVTLSNISDAVFMTSDDGSFTYICPNVNVIFGYSQAEVTVLGNIGKLLGDNLFASEELDTRTEIQNIERQISTKTALDRVLLVNVKRVSIRGSTVLYTCHDITERKQADEAIRKSEQVLREAESLGHTGSWEQNLVTGEIFNTEENLRLFFGDDRSKGANFEDYSQIVHPDDHEYVLRRRTELLEEEGPSDIEYRVIWPDGSIHVIFGRATVVRNELGQAIRVYGTNVDVTERKRAEEELAKRAEQMRALAGYVESVREDERTRIAREIHDEFGQFLTALKMDLAWVSRRLPDGDEKRERLNQASSLVDENVVRVQRIATELRPGLLDDLGLITALDWQAHEFSKHTSILCELNLPQQDLGLNPSLNTTLFRIFQETLTNVARHAQASRVDVSLYERDQMLLLTIRDNGRGITDTELNDSNSLGLLGLRERVAQWKGDLSIRGEAGKGTTVLVRIPIPSSENGDSS